MSVNRFDRSKIDTPDELQSVATKGQQRLFVGTKDAVQQALNANNIGENSIVYITDDYDSETVTEFANKAELANSVKEGAVMVKTGSSPVIATADDIKPLRTDVDANKTGIQNVIDGVTPVTKVADNVLDTFLNGNIKTAKVFAQDNFDYNTVSKEAGNIGLCRIYGQNQSHAPFETNSDVLLINIYSEDGTLSGYYAIQIATLTQDRNATIKIRQCNNKVFGEWKEISTVGSWKYNYEYIGQGENTYKYRLLAKIPLKFNSSFYIKGYIGRGGVSLVKYPFNICIRRWDTNFYMYGFVSDSLPNIDIIVSKDESNCYIYFYSGDDKYNTINCVDSNIELTQKCQEFDSPTGIVQCNLNKLALAKMNGSITNLHLIVKSSGSSNDEDMAKHNRITRCTKGVKDFIEKAGLCLSMTNGTDENGQVAIIPETERMYFRTQFGAWGGWKQVATVPTQTVQAFNAGIEKEI